MIRDDQKTEQQKGRHTSSRQVLGQTQRRASACTARQMESRDAGFTLFELIIALTIAAILTVLSYPSFSYLLARQRQVVTISEVRQLLRFSRFQAISRQQTVTLCALDNRSRCHKKWSGRRYVVFLDDNQNRKLEADEEILAQEQWPAVRGELNWRASLGRSWLSFASTGRTVQNGSFYYCPPGGDVRLAMAIVVSRTGREYVPADSNGDGIRENASGRNLSC